MTTATDPTAEMDVFNMGEVAQRLGIAKDTAYRWASRGLLPVRRLGGRTVVPKAAFYRWLEETTPESEQAK